MSIWALTAICILAVVYTRAHGLSFDVNPLLVLIFSATLCRVWLLYLHETYNIVEYNKRGINICFMSVIHFVSAVSDLKKLVIDSNNNNNSQEVAMPMQKILIGSAVSLWCSARVYGIPFLFIQVLNGGVLSLFCGKYGFDSRI